MTGPLLADVISAVAAKWSLEPGDLTGPRRHRHLVRARQEAMYECRMQTGKYLTIIGRAFNRDHTTILYGIRAHVDRLERASTGLCSPTPLTDETVSAF